jgi:hypothetical protein
MNQDHDLLLNLIESIKEEDKKIKKTNSYKKMEQNEFNAIKQEVYYNSLIKKVLELQYKHPEKCPQILKYEHLYSFDKKDLEEIIKYYEN